MDANIKTAAGLLRNASYNLQCRIRELESDENNIQHHVSQEERHIKSDLVNTGIQLANTGEDNQRAQFLMRRGLELRKRSKQIKYEADKKVSAEEQEIRTLKSQVSRLNELAHMLEMWR